MVATQDAHYVNKDDEVCQEVLLAVQTNKKWKDADRWRFSGHGYYLKSESEMIEGFEAQACLTKSQYEDAIKNTVEVAKKCSFSIAKKEVCLPQLPDIGLFSFPGDDPSLDMLKRLCEEGFDKKVVGAGKSVRKYQLRLDEEIALIEDKGFMRYFLMVWEVVVWSKKNGIMVGPGRGSSSGSIVCWLLGITLPDPIEHDLVFARFIAPNRGDNPDIDIDFEDAKRGQIRKHLEDLYGKWNVAGISTFAEMKGKSALRDVSRVFDVPLSDVNRVCAVVVSKLEGEDGADTTIADAFEVFEEGKAFKRKYPEVSGIAVRLEGGLRSRGQHAAAVVVSDEDLRLGTRCAFVLGKDKEPIVNWDKHDIEHVGLMKLDVLGLKMLTVLNNVKEKVTDEVINFDDIVFDDRRCFREFSKGNSVGCFQLGSQGLRTFCQQLGIKDFKTLVHATALYRPGPLRSGEAQIFVERKNGRMNTPSQHPVIDRITKDTYGVIIYQEQVMQLVHEFAGLDWTVADRVRKIIAKSKGEGALKAFETQFVDGCVKTSGYDAGKAAALWQTLLTCGGYLFNLSHAVAYSMITYWCMKMKLDHPVEFICALLSYGVSDSDPKDKKSEYIAEAFRMGLDVRPPKIGKSDTREWSVKDGVLYMPFIDIKGVGDETVKTFNCLRNGFFDSKGPAPRFMKILSEIKADVDEPISDEEAERISPYLDASLVRDKLHKYKKLKNRLDDAVKFEMRGVSELDARNSFYWFGTVTEINLSAKKDGDGNNAYGMFKYGDNLCRVNFGDNLYARKKLLVESSGGEIAIIRGVVKKQGIQVVDAWFSSEIASGCFDGLNMNFVSPARHQQKELVCDACELRQECSEPVQFSPGRSNMMIVAESPGRSEDKQGRGLCGDNLVWKELEKGSLCRREFHVTSVIKCWPSKSKTPTRKHVEKCRNWLGVEMDVVKPVVVLGFGNAAVKFFTDSDSGIMQKNGSTEWNEKYGCWVCWCISSNQAAVSQENLELFQVGVDNFVKKIRNLGFVSFFY
jgi:uracil-DNA glycosylase family 4